MANRPVFCCKEVFPYVEIKHINFLYYSGFSSTQKKKSVKSLHEEFLKQNSEYNILEISSKSEKELGVQLSAFNLMVKTSTREFSVENAFQSSKVFEKGGPYVDLLEKTSKAAKKDERLKESGKLVAFSYFNKVYPLEPKDYFYNWIYMNALHLKSSLVTELMNYDAFTDIEFNPQKSINCQAKAVALYVSLKRARLIENALSSQENFLKIIYGKDVDSKPREEKEEVEQLTFTSMGVELAIIEKQHKKVSVVDRYSYEFEEISCILNNLENGRIYEKTGWGQDDYLSTNIQKLRELLISLLSKIENNDPKEKEKIYNALKKYDRK